jgi:hypothetical protein
MKKAGLYVSIEFNRQWNPETDYRLIPHVTEQLQSVGKPFSKEC